MSLTLHPAGEFRLTTGEVHSWCVSLDVPLQRRARLQATLSPQERGRSDRLRFAPVRTRYIVAHGSLREILGSYLQVPPERIWFWYNPFGKPELAPEFGGDLRFNLSHSGGMALIAVTAGARVGVDLEHMSPKVDQDDRMEIARSFFSPADVDRLQTLPSGLSSRAFFRCWTRLEARAKAHGGGLTADPRSPADGVAMPGWSVYSFRPAPDYLGAVAVEGSASHLVQRLWRPSSDPPN